MKTKATKKEAVYRLRVAGFTREAEALKDWRDRNGNNWGWDGWIRKKYPYVVSIIWPTKY